MWWAAPTARSCISTFKEVGRCPNTKKKDLLPFLHYPVLVVFSLFFIGLFALDMVTPDRSYSELENTTLSQRPALTQFTAKGGLNNYFTSYTRYVKDQVFGRDQWISLQSVAETTLLQKGAERRHPAGAKQQMMFPRTYGPAFQRGAHPAQKHRRRGSTVPAVPRQGECTAGPGCIGYYPENVPANAPLLDEDAYLDSLSDAVQAAGGRFVDARQTP